MLIYEHFSNRNLRIADLLFDELTERNPNIIEIAIKDANTIIESAETEKYTMKVVDIKRLDYMSQSELSLIFQSIGAAKSNYSFEAGFAKDVSLVDILGLDIKNLVVCSVSGDSMIDAQINEGDLLLVDTAMKPENDHIVIANVDGELFVKKYCKKNGKIKLISENPKYAPIEVSEYSYFEIYGVVRDIIKTVIK